MGKYRLMAAYWLVRLAIALIPGRRERALSALWTASTAILEAQSEEGE